MKIKKIFAIALVCFFAMYSVSFAAIGGGKIKSSPAPKASTSQSATTPKADTSKDGYKASAPANSYSDKAPAANSKTSATAAKTQSGSAMGGMLRNIGLLAGGMMLGSLLGNMFGMGAGMFSDILGLLTNVLIFGAIFMVGKILWNKFKNRNKDKDDYYRNNRN